MKNICFVTCGALPVPAGKGGAIEQLIEILITENEKRPRFLFTVITCCDSIVDQAKKKYQYTHFVCFTHPGYWEQKLWWKVRGGIRRVTKQDIPLILPYNRKVESFLCKKGERFDFIINEGCEIGVFDKPSLIHGKNKFVNHIHCETFATPLQERIFGHFISVGEFIKKQFSSSFTDKNINVHTLKNCIDLNQFNKIIDLKDRCDIRHQLGFSPNDFLIIYCGRLIPEKGVRELIEALTTINIPYIKLMIVGSSNFQGAKMTNYQKSIINRAKEYKERIVFTGYVNNRELYRFHKAANLAIIPSTCEEAFNIAILEFMASGLPTIATRSGGMVEEGTTETTMFINKDSNLINNIRNAILTLYNDSTKLKEMSEYSIKRSQLFSKESYLVNFETIVNSMITL